MNKKKIYISHPIEKIWINTFQKIANNSLLSQEYDLLMPYEIKLYRKLIKSCDYFVVEASGQCYQSAIETGLAIGYNKIVIALHQQERPCSKMISLVADKTLRYLDIHSFCDRVAEAIRGIEDENPT